MKHSYLNTKEHRPLVQLRFEDKSSATLLSLSQSLTRGLIKKYECFIKSTKGARASRRGKLSVSVALWNSVPKSVSIID